MSQVLKSLLPAYGGYTIAKDEKVIFIRGAIPGELVEVDIETRKRDYSVASVRHILEPSEYRIEPECRVFGTCGGCQLQFIAYDRQLSMKDEILRDSLSRIGGIDTGLYPVISDRPWNYRRRAQFKISREGKIGFFRESTREVIAFDECPLMIDKINSLLKNIKDRAMLGNLSELHIAAGDSAVGLLKGEDYDEDLCELFLASGLSGVALNETHCAGEAYCHLDLNGLGYTVSPWTFFQAHWNLNRKVASIILENLMPLDGKKILDLYAGAGNFSLPLAAYADRIVAVEENQYSIADGNRNITLNNLKNFRFMPLSAEKYRIKNKFDVIILDPPRPGLAAEVCSKILEYPPDIIVYLSCNPATLARDLKKLKSTYDIRSVQQIDFFPHTFHIESLVFLEIK